MEAKVITILNRLARQDSQTGLDVWYKQVLKDVPYKIEKVTNVVGTTVSMGETFTILIPFNDKYLPYNEWKQALDKDSVFTLSQGDIIVLDAEVDDTITPNTIPTIKNKYKPKACEVRSIVEVPKRPGVNIQLKVSGI